MTGTDYYVRQLGRNQHGQAYPLLQASGAPYSLPEWLDMAQSLCRPTADRPSGILTVQSDGDYIHALLTYVVRPALSGSPCLEVSNICITGFFNFPVAPMLLNGIEHLASRHDCASVRIDVPANENRLSHESPDSTGSMFADAGYQVETLRLQKTLSRH